MTGKGTCLHVSTICFWVAGGFSTVKLYNRIRGDRPRGVQKVMLTYLKLNILNLIYSVLPCLWPPRAPNPPLKHQKPHFFPRQDGGKPEVTLCGRVSLGPSNPPLVLKKQ